jgi:hypothetical protein
MAQGKHVRRSLCSCVQPFVFDSSSPLWFSFILFVGVFPSFSMVVFWFGYCDGIHDCATSQNITVSNCSLRRHKLHISTRGQVVADFPDASDITT